MISKLQPIKIKIAGFFTCPLHVQLSMVHIWGVRFLVELVYSATGGPDFKVIHHIRLIMSRIQHTTLQCFFPIRWECMYIYLSILGASLFCLHLGLNSDDFTHTCIHSTHEPQRCMYMYLSILGASLFCLNFDDWLHTHTCIHSMHEPIRWECMYTYLSILRASLFCLHLRLN